MDSEASTTSSLNSNSVKSLHEAEEAGAKEEGFMGRVSRQVTNRVSPAEAEEVDSIAVSKIISIKAMKSRGKLWVATLL